MRVFNELTGRQTLFCMFIFTIHKIDSWRSQLLAGHAPCSKQEIVPQLHMHDLVRSAIECLPEND